MSFQTLVKIYQNGKETDELLIKARDYFELQQRLSKFKDKIINNFKLLGYRHRETPTSIYFYDEYTCELEIIVEFEIW